MILCENMFFGEYIAFGENMAFSENMAFGEIMVKHVFFWVKYGFW